MITLLTITGTGAFGIAVGIVAVVSIGVKREERRFRALQRLREERFFRTGEIDPAYLPQDAPDGLTWGARRMTGVWVRRQPTVAAQAADEDLLMR